MKNIVLFVILCGVLVPCSIQAQNESGVRVVTPAEEDIWKNRQKLWYDSTHTLRKVYPIIRSIPPLSTSMPLDVLYGYIGLDSLVRFVDESAVDFGGMLNGWTLSNDTLTNALKYMYILRDYNPIILTQYLEETRMDDDKYKVHLSSLQSTLIRYTRNLLPESDKGAFQALMSPDYILRVKILGTIDSAQPIDVYSGRYQIAAEVLDTLKGQVFEELVVDNNTSVHGITTTSGNPIITFVYTDSELSTPRLRMSHPSLTLNNNIHFPDGVECVVFLKHYNWLGTTTVDTYHLGTSLYASFPLYIENDMVHDHNLHWSTSGVMSYSAWKQKFDEMLQKIMTGSY